ncbi:uncharacterized protein LOC127734563 [Mytilus californianus]|uniref:uncharacterized protein LOC127734563 n=1 Tax=Mytilus californianus TaxID=6549 RepID=UPI002246DAB2|nr:uncharacterized protein LOC127734563 [Mytilus californianus]XP_052100459.1 uncharacterized protein LOC127734563 [Mytilus californianus]
MSEGPNTFTKYFKSVMRSVNLSTSDKDINDIKKLTKNLIGKIWEKALNENKKFELSEVIPVGSMEEGSRLFSAHEFDFMMILQMKDFPVDKIVLKEGCRPGFVRLLLEDPTARLNDCFKNNQLHFWEFRKHLLSQLQKVGDLSEKSGNLKQIKRNLADMGLRPNVQHAVLQILGEHEIEAWNVLFKWHDTEISVDTMPAIEITREQIEHFERVHGSLLFHDEKHKDRAFAINRKCYLVPKGCQKDDDEEGCGCWLIDFAPAEVAILKTMNNIHRNCQKFLKYILSNYHDLPSYLVKSAVVKNFAKCTGSSSEQICTLDILHYISKRLDDAYLPDPFLRNLNVFGWKEADQMRPLSPIETAIIFEHHSRYVDLLLHIIRKMTQENITIRMNSAPNPSLVDLGELMAIEKIMPLSPKLPLLNDFIDQIKPALEKFIAQKKWSSIAELRTTTKPYLKELKWDPIEDFKKQQLECAKYETGLKLLFQ